MKRTVACGLLGVIAVGGLMPAHCAAKIEATDERAAALALFRSDTRLQPRITLAQKERPLGEVVAALGSQLQVRLSCTRATADDRVTLFLDNRPAAEVLALLADQFDFHWSKQGETYQLEQSLAAQRREADLRSAYLQVQWDRNLALARHVERLSGMDPWQRNQREEQLTAALKRPGIPSEEAEALQIEAQALRDLDHPAAKVSTRLLSALVKPAQLQQVRQGRDLRLSTLDHSLDLAWMSQIDPPDTRNRRSDKEVHPRLDFILQFQEQEPYPQLPSDHFSQAVSRASGVLYDPRWYLNFHLPYGTLCTDSSLPWNASPMLPAPVPVLEVSDDPLWKQEVLLHRPAVPLKEDRTDLAYYKRQKLISLGDLAEALHQETGTEVLADGFVRARFPASEFTTRLPVRVLLERLARQRFSVRKESNLLRFRNNLFFLDRSKEVPESLLQPLRRGIAANGSVTLDDLATLAARVEGPRFQGLIQWWRGYFESGPIADPDLANQLRKHRRDLQFWVSLSATQRQLARNGASLSILQLTVSQRQRLLAALDYASENTWPSWVIPRISAEQLPALNFRLEQHTVREQSFRQDHPGGSATQTAYRLDPANPPMIPEGSVPVGEPVTLDEVVFVYAVANREEPLYRAPIPIRRSTPQ